MPSPRKLRGSSPSSKRKRMRLDAARAKAAGMTAKARDDIHKSMVLKWAATLTLASVLADTTRRIVAQGKTLVVEATCAVCGAWKSLMHFWPGADAKAMKTAPSGGEPVVNSREHGCGCNVEGALVPAHCKSRKSSGCAAKPFGSYSMYGTLDDPSAWCSPCAAIEYAQRGTPHEQRANLQDKCQRCKLMQPNYGLVGDPRMWCGPCSALEYTERGITLEGRADVLARCQRCKLVVPSLGLAGNPRMWCSPCAVVEYQERNTPMEQRVDANIKCQRCKRVVPSFGLKDNPKMWCGPCAYLEYAARDTPLVQRADAHPKCQRCNLVQPNYGIIGDPRKWCGPCSDIEYAVRGTPQEQRADATPKCQRCKLVRPNYGLVDDPRKWCGPCSVLEYAARGTPLEQRADVQPKCQRCKRVQPNYGIGDDPRKWCGPCSVMEYAERDTPLAQRADTLPKCQRCDRVQPNYGLVDDPRKWCGPCSVVEYAERDTPLEDRADSQAKCAHEGCNTRPNAGTPAAPRAWCAPHARLHWIEHATPATDRINSSGRMATASRSYSRVSIDYLDWLAVQLGTPIQHAESKDDDRDELLGEHKLAVAGSKWRADGFIKQHKLAIEFHGCAWHGCPACFPDRARVMLGKTMEERYAATAARTAEIRAAGYAVAEVWEHEWSDMLADEDARAAHVASVRRSMGEAVEAPRKKQRLMTDFQVQ